MTTSVPNPSEPDRTTEPTTLTTDDLATYMRLPSDILAKRGVRTSKDSSHVIIPYEDEKAKPLGEQYRYKLGKDDPPDGQPRFRLKKGFSPKIYGEGKLFNRYLGKKPPSSKKKRMDTIRLTSVYPNLNIVEGASDVWAFDAIEQPALGFYSAAVFDLQPLEKFADDFETITIFIEPDSGGEKILRTLESQMPNSPIADKIRLMTSRNLIYKNRPCNDIREFREAATTTFKKRFEEAHATASTFDQYIDSKKEFLREAFRELDVTDGVGAIVDAVHKTGVVGEDVNIRVAALCAISIISDDPVNLVLKGASSSGKSFVLSSVLNFIPDDYKTFRSSFSPLALVYSEEDFRHKILFLGEYDGISTEPLARTIVRQILTEKRIKHETVINGKSEMLSKEGPIGFWTTTVDAVVEGQLETRLVSSEIDSSAEQTARVIRQKTNRSQKGAEAYYVDYGPHHAKFEYIATENPRIRIPWLDKLEELIPELKNEERMRRDWDKAINLIEADVRINHTRLARDSDGFYLADVRTYEHMKPVLEWLFAYALNKPTDIMIETVGAIKYLLDNPPEGALKKARMVENDRVELTNAMVQQHLGLSKGATHERMQRATEAGYIVNLETRFGARARIVMGDRILRVSADGENALMPDVTELFDGGSVVRLSSGETIELINDDNYDYPIVPKKLVSMDLGACRKCGGSKFWSNPKISEGWSCNTCTGAPFKTDMIVGTTAEGDYLFERA